MTRAIIYTRFSPRPNADDCESCDRQLELCTAYSTRQGYTVDATFEDRAVSGGDLDRPGLIAAIAELRQGDILVVAARDRLARDMLVALTITAQVCAKGARVEYADGSPNDTTPEGKLFGNILAAFAAYERDRIRGRTKAGLQRKRDAGMHLGAVPIGYRRGVDGSLERDENEWRHVQQIFLRASAGLKSKEIADEMNTNGWIVRGKLWGERTIRRILEREKDALDERGKRLFGG